MNNTHTVHLDELTAQCAGFVNGGETWNGWAQPIFTAEQLAPIRTWWDTHDLTGETGERWEDQITQLSDDEYILPGWCWETTN